MALANFNNQEQPLNPSQSYQETVNQPTSKLLAKVFGYMFVALLVTFAVAVGTAALFFYVLFGAHTLQEVIDAFNTGNFTPPLIGYLSVLGVSFIALLIMSFVTPITLSRDKHSGWPVFIIYATLMGILLSTFVLIVDLVTIAEALGITVLVFLVMFLIGHFSKVNLNPVGLIAIGLLFMMLLLGSFWFLWWWLNPGAFKVIDLVFSIIVCVLMMIITAVDAYNIRKTLERGQASRNVLLFCAFVLYSDFITLLIRILIILAKLKNK